MKSEDLKPIAARFYEIATQPSKRDRLDAARSTASEFRRAHPGDPDVTALCAKVEAADDPRTVRNACAAVLGLDPEPEPDPEAEEEEPEPPPPPPKAAPRTRKRE